LNINARKYKREAWDNAVPSPVNLGARLISARKGKTEW
jgi:hypothetical protein